MSETATLPSEIDAPPVGAGPFYEIVNGQVVEPPEMGVFETWIATVLSDAIVLHFAQSGRRLGRTAVETLFRLDPESKQQRRPDLAFVSFERWPRDRPVPRAAAWDVAPDLAVEVISPTDLTIEVLEKVRAYFRAGVRQVWLVFPREGVVHVYDSPKRITVLDAMDDLEGGAILPGFRLRLADLFDETAGAGPAG